MTHSQAVTTLDGVESALIGGDLAKLSPGERLAYYSRTCESLGLNPLTRPFQYLTLNGRMLLYATRDCTDQLRRIHGISVTITGREMMADAGVYVVTARGTDRDGRSDESVGAVACGGAKGEALANVLMKAETKAKRRVTLSLAGLGWMDETEADTVPAARPVNVDENGEILGPAPATSSTATRTHPSPEAADLGKWLKEAGWKFGDEHVRMVLRQKSSDVLGINEAVRAWIAAHPGALADQWAGITKQIGDMHAELNRSASVPAEVSG